ncbi:Fc.00g073580.m01.CDS01 [Cosmosporella sp. VM-42]
MENVETNILVLFLLLLLQSGLLFYAVSVDNASASILSSFANFILQRSAGQCTYRKGGQPVPALNFEWPNGQGTQKFFEGRASSIRWRQEKGFVYQIWAGFKPEIVLTQPEHLRDFFHDSDKHQKAPNNNSGWLIGQVLGSCLGLVSGSRWVNMRIPWEHPFSLPSAKSYVSRMSSSARNFVQNLESQAGDSSTTHEIQATQSLKTYPFFLVASILFGELSGAQREALLNLAPLREELWKEGIHGGQNRTLLAKYFGTRGYRLLAEFKTRWREFIENAYEESIAHGKNGAIEKLLKQAKEGKYLTVEEVGHQSLSLRPSCKRYVTNSGIFKCMQTLDETLYANLDVTTSAVTWSHVLLAQHQAFQDELRTEVRDHMQLPKEEWEKYINRSDTLLAYSVLEASRLRPILAFSNPESAPTDKLVGDVFIPGHTDVIVDTHSINVAHPFWTNGTEYNPHRFEKLQPRQYRYHFWRFGFGPRKCLGQHVADRMVRALLAEMLSRYRLSVSESLGNQDFQLQDQSWVLLPDIMIKCSRV